MIQTLLYLNSNIIIDLLKYFVVSFTIFRGLGLFVWGEVVSFAFLLTVVGDDVEGTAEEIVSPHFERVHNGKQLTLMCGVVTLRG